MDLSIAGTGMIQQWVKNETPAIEQQIDINLLAAAH
jgi:hypothetical protein